MSSFLQAWKNFVPFDYSLKKLLQFEAISRNLQMSSIVERKSLQFGTQKLNNPMSFCPFSTLIYFLNLT
jgi:hypothetical protein